MRKIALLDAVIPGVEPVWTKLYHSNWWFGFFARPVAGEVVAGKAGEFLTDFWSVVGHKKDAFTKEEIREFIRAYSVPGATTGSFHWFGAFPRDAEDNQEFIKIKLSVPMLAMSGEFSAGPFFTDHCKLVDNNVTGIVIPGSGHWLVQENTAAVLKGLEDFFEN